jgi:hypothetical protein
MTATPQSRPLGRARGVLWLRVGLIAWAMVFALLLWLRSEAHASWALALFPVWGPPALVLAYVGWSIALAVLLIVVAIFWRIAATCIGVRP